MMRTIITLDSGKNRYLTLFPACLVVRPPWHSNWIKLAKLGLVIVCFIDYDYDYYGYSDYRGGYSDPYYDDYYRYEDYYYDYPPAAPQARGRGRQPQPVGGL